MDNVKMTTTLNSYEFTYYGWIPSYRDFDQEWITVEAATQEDAWDIIRKKLQYIKSIELLSINGQLLTSNQG